MIRIIHITDTHLTGDGQTIWGADVKANFDSAIAHIKQMKSDIDAIFLTGDLSDDGTMKVINT